MGLDRHRFGIGDVVRCGTLGVNQLVVDVNDGPMIVTAFVRAGQVVEEVHRADAMRLVAKAPSK